ncbi:MAG: prolyl oligopeptidase family serine peptidase [Gemmatimonadota bacterium]|nr:prolyl oligopeptidase family serine peptidase [Gemmatimonadota bacterium]
MRYRRLYGAVGITILAFRSIGAQSKPTIDQFLKPGFPEGLVSAKTVDRIAWLANERGQRNVYTAVAPSFKPVRLTSFLEDNGVVLTDLSISDDGQIVSFVRGSAPNAEGWFANPSSDPNGPTRTIWAARTNGSGASSVAVGGAPVLAPNGNAVLYVRDGQIYRVVLPKSGAFPAVEKDAQPYIKGFGRNGDPQWSPNSATIAYVSVREYHALIGLYDVSTRTVHYASPSIDFDGSPTWSSDSRRIAFTRRPGTPFGQQTNPGLSLRGLPPAPNRAGRAGGGGDTKPDGMYRAAFRGGYTLAVMVVDAVTDSLHEVWHSVPNAKTFVNIGRIKWAGENLIFAQEPEDWTRLYSVNANGGTATPIELTPGAGEVETFGYSADGKTLYYGSNVGDPDRRHVWKVPTAGGAATQLTTGNEIEMSPAPLASGKQVAVLTSSALRPMSVGIVALSDAKEKIIYPTLDKDFPTSAEVVPQAVTLKAADGMQFYNQLFVPKDIKSGEKRPALIFVHGGPPRQMLLGYHYMDFYHTAYATNQWLSTLGYVVLSVNYRLGIGYGKTFRTAPNSGEAGNAEYGDVLAAAKYLQSRPDVDASRVGIWGLSYGGILTAEALARNSDIFAAGVDMAGVHVWGNSLDTSTVAYKASAVSAIDKWKSPVLIWQGDDDRNVPFSQTIGLVNLLRQRDVYYELMVMPDDTHETLIHKRWLSTFARMQTFLQRFLWDKK